MKEVAGFNKYKINESGVIINKNGHVMRSAQSNSGYLRVVLEENDSTHRKNESVHRLVAKTFIPNPDNLPVVMHLDNDPLNNHVSNLQWGTQSKNIKQAFKEGRKISPAKYNITTYNYELYNDSGDSIICNSRQELAETIGYEEISLKNMVGNGRKIALGEYEGYMIRRLDRNKHKLLCTVVE